ncbi:LysR substrate-binding domain-containing protein [Aestuariivirga sp.]|uniref:LysR substrate-binding domain-containing protein n=1 Tax=Aestuariivirga sp. TaxID=2650926 RepID=UPI00391A697B
MALDRSRLPLHALRAFEAAARHRNLVRAAEELGVTHGAVSHQIRALEEALKTQLFDRRHRPISLTTSGEQLLSAVDSAFDRLSRAAGALRAGELEGEITISCVPGLASNWLVPKLGEFLVAHSSIAVHVVTEYWQHPTIADQCDLAIAYGSAEHPGKRVVLLGHSAFFPVCSPTLLAGCAPLQAPEDIADHTLLHEYSDETWSRWFVAAGLKNILARRQVYFDGAHLSLQAARSGYGLAMGDIPTVGDDLIAGSLVQPFTLSVPAAYPYYLIAPPKAEQSAPGRALEEWLIEKFKEITKLLIP